VLQGGGEQNVTEVIMRYVGAERGSFPVLTLTISELSSLKKERVKMEES